jgi:hypothetical protein
VKGLKDAAKKLKEYQDSQKTEAEKNAEALKTLTGEEGVRSRPRTPRSRHSSRRSRRA